MKRLPFAVFLLLFHPLLLAAQETGAVHGRVTDRDGRALEDVSVSVGGGTAVIVTDAEGRYTLRVPAGRVRLRVHRIDHRVVERVLRVPAGGEARADFALVPTPVVFGGPIVVAEPDTPEWRGPTVGVAAHVDSFSVAERTAAETFSELLAGQVPGLVVRRFSGTAGAASRLELRGPSSIGLRRQPLLVIDGRRAISEEQSLSINLGGGASLSSYDDLDPDMVESVTVLPGPAAAARYGPAAANGVVEVRTRRGAQGRPRWRAFAEAGLRDDPGGYPANFAQVGHNFDGERNPNCDLLFQSGGVCTPLPDSLKSFNPLERSSPFRAGSRLGAGVSVEGGTGLVVSYAAGAGYRRALGVQEENDDRLANARASVAVRPLGGVEVRVSAAHLRRETAPVVEGPTLLSVIAAGLLGSADSTGNGGYHPAFRRDFDPWDASHASRRTLAGAEASWAPFGWLTLGARYGIDRAHHDESSRLSLSPPNAGSLVGVVERERELRTAGADAGVRLRLGAVDSRTWLGVERVSERASFFARQDAPNGTFTETESRARRAVLGVLLRQAVAAGPLAVEAGVRRDEPRDRDEELWSGSAGAAWAVGRVAPWLDGVRLRAAYGRSERSPESVPGIDGPDVLVVSCGGPADECDLRPQRSSEAEAGLDLRLLDRVDVRLTGYVRDDRDVFFLEGSVAGARWGTEVRNTGAELSLRAPLLSRPGVEWEMELLGWANRNRVTARPEGVGPLIGPIGAIVEGRPIGAYYARPILGFADRDDDGIIDRLGCPGGPDCEIELGDTAAYLGSPVPTRMVALASRLRLGGRVTLSARLEHQGGAKLLNSIGYIRCGAFRNCREVVDRATPLAGQARAAAAQLGSPAGFVEDADFVKLREVALTVSAPEAWSRRIGAAGVELTIAGRNLATWTSYSGLDPEINTLPDSPYERVDIGSQPLPRTVTTRVELRF